MNRCRVCNSSELTQFLDLGAMPLANALLSTIDQPEQRFPLTAMYCHKCGLVQLGQVVHGLYDVKYPYKTGCSSRMVSHYVEQIDDRVYRCPSGAAVLEIGCNDGSVLREASRRHGGLAFVGMDPAAQFYHRDNLMLIPSVFGEKTVDDVTERFHLIVANNVMGHVDDLDDFMRGVKRILHPDGRFIFEVPDLARTVGAVQYWQFYHEHLSYFSPSSVNRLMAVHGMRVAIAKNFDVHGGSTRYTCVHGARPGDERSTPSIPLSELEQFARNTQLAINDLRELPGNYVGYCASAKGAVILNAAGIGLDLVSVVVDNTPEKQGKFMPGTHQLIVKPEFLSSCDPAQTKILCLAPNHINEIRQKHPEFQQWVTP